MKPHIKVVSKEEYLKNVKQFDGKHFISIFQYSTFKQIQTETSLNLQQIYNQYENFLISKESREDMDFYDFFFRGSK